MISFHSFRFLYCHSAFRASVDARAFVFFMIDYVHSGNHCPTVNARNFDEWAYSFMLSNIPSNTFCTTFIESKTFHRLKFTLLIMLWNIGIIQYFVTAHLMVATFKLHFLELLFNFRFDTQEFRFSTLHWTHTSISMEFFQTFVMKSFFATFALERVH